MIYTYSGKRLKQNKFERNGDSIQLATALYIQIKISAYHRDEFEVQNDFKPTETFVVYKIT